MELVQQNVSIVHRNSGRQLTLRVANREFPCDSLGRIIVVGAGKAAEAMATGIEESLRPFNSIFSRLEGIVNVPGFMNAPSHRRPNLHPIETCRCRPIGANLPTDAVVAASKRILALLETTTENDLCIFLISGGASALLEVPADPVSLADLRQLTDLLTQNGTPIEELNLVRGHLSQVKRGRLLERAAPANSVALILSDVVGNCIESIGSGPTVAVNSVPKKALDTLRKRIPDPTLIPGSVLTRLDRLVAESTTNPPDAPDTCHSNALIGSLETAVEACVAKATELGFETASTILVDEGDVSETALILLNHWNQLQKEAAPQCLIIGGEPTVSTSGQSGQSGIGGRNTHLILETLRHLLIKQDDRPPFENACIASLSTDGEDGNAPASGAILEPHTVQFVSTHRLSASAQAALERFDSFRFLEPLGAIVPIKPTRTNVGDLRILLTSKPTNRAAPLNQP